MFFDSHAHYDDKRFNKDRHSLLMSMADNQVDYIVNAGAHIPSSREGIALAEKYSLMYTSVGVHPHNVKDLSEDAVATLETLSQHPKVVAIGEIGLDYYYDHSPRDVQRMWFQRQMDLAKKLDLPIIVHSREAAQEVFDMVKASGLTDGVIHCYSGSAEMAKKYVKLGFYIGIGGTVTFDNARIVREVAREIPLESIVIETDCPYLSPAPHRGKRNNSTYLKYIAQKIGDIKGISIEEVGQVTTYNAKKLYRIVD